MFKQSKKNVMQANNVMSQHLAVAHQLLQMQLANVLQVVGYTRQHDAEAEFIVFASSVPINKEIVDAFSKAIGKPVTIIRTTGKLPSPLMQKGPPGEVMPGPEVETTRTFPKIVANPLDTQEMTNGAQATGPHPVEGTPPV